MSAGEPVSVLCSNSDSGACACVNPHRRGLGMLPSTMSEPRFGFGARRAIVCPCLPLAVRSADGGCRLGCIGWGGPARQASSLSEARRACSDMEWPFCWLPISRGRCRHGIFSGCSDILKAARNEGQWSRHQVMDCQSCRLRVTPLQSRARLGRIDRSGRARLLTRELRFADPDGMAICCPLLSCEGYAP